MKKFAKKAEFGVVSFSDLETYSNQISPLHHEKADIYH